MGEHTAPTGCSATTHCPSAISPHPCSCHTTNMLCSCLGRRRVRRRIKSLLEDQSRTQRKHVAVTGDKGAKVADVWLCKQPLHIAHAGTAQVEWLGVGVNEAMAQPCSRRGLNKRKAGEHALEVSHKASMCKVVRQLTEGQCITPHKRPVGAGVRQGTVLRCQQSVPRR